MNAEKFALGVTKIVITVIMSIARVVLLGFCGMVMLRLGVDGLRYWIHAVPVIPWLTAFDIPVGIGIMISVIMGIIEK